MWRTLGYIRIVRSDASGRVTAKAEGRQIGKEGRERKTRTVFPFTWKKNGKTYDKCTKDETTNGRQGCGDCRGQIWLPARQPEGLWLTAVLALNPVWQGRPFSTGMACVSLLPQLCRATQSIVMVMTEVDPSMRTSLQLLPRSWQAGRGRLCKVWLLPNSGGGECHDP